MIDPEKDTDVGTKLSARSNRRVAERLWGQSSETARGHDWSREGVAQTTTCSIKQQGCPEACPCGTMARGWAG